MLSRQFQSITGLDFEIISTVDHPYVSPPIRLLDSHRKLLKLHKKQRVCVLNWDVSQPNDRTYRYDLQIDLGFIIKNKSLFLFNEKEPYALQSPNPINIQLYDETLNIVLSYALNQNILTKESIHIINANYLKMKDGVVKKIMSKTNRLYPDYTKLILENMYSLLSLPDISTFIKDNYLYYFKSNLMNKWIPFCIENAKERRSIESVMRSNVFGRKVFRSIDKTVDEEIINNPSYIEKNKAEIVDLIKRNMIIPSVEVLYWSIEVAGKYHFGNDYGFYERYQKHLNEKLSNQITKMREDGINYLEMNNDYGIPYNIGVGKLIPRNIHGQVKNTRINSLFAFYILLGDNMPKYLNTPQAMCPMSVEISDGYITVT